MEKRSIWKTTIRILIGLVIIVILVDFLRIYYSRALSGRIGNIDKYCKHLLQEYKINKFKFYDPAKFHTHADAARCYKRFNQYEKAIKSYQAALRYPPIRRMTNEHYKNSVFIGLAECFYSLNKPKMAIQYYQKAIAVEPEINLAYFGLAKAYMMDGQKELAIEEYKHAISLFEGSDNFRSNFTFHLGLAYVEIGNKEMALKKYEELKAKQLENKEKYSMSYGKHEKKFAEELLNKIQEKFGSL